MNLKMALMGLTSRGGEFTPKSLIIDIADNWSHFIVGGRSIELTNGGGVITNNASLASFYATTSSSSSQLPEFIFDTSLSKTGTEVDNTWMSTFSSNTNQRLISVFNTPPAADGITINNFRSAAGETSIGMKNIKIYSSPNIVTNTAYGSELTGATLIFDGVIAEHVASDVIDDQILTLINL